MLLGQRCIVFGEGSQSLPRALSDSVADVKGRICAPTPPHCLCRDPCGFISSVHMKIEETISLTCGRDGGLQNMELHGMIMLRILDEKFARIRIHVENEDKKGVQLQVGICWLRIWEHVAASPSTGHRPSRRHCWLISGLA